ncbi:hypothetical protein BTVI_54744 [Pitangus sulphuratus]|nr:hypothetical protein BTVI_54744 [Pitangus sulphuratus]
MSLHWKVMHLKQAGMGPCIMHERAEKRLWLGILVAVGPPVTTCSQCQACDTSGVLLPDLLGEVCLQLQVVQHLRAFPRHSALLGRTQLRTLLEKFLWIRKDIESQNILSWKGPTRINSWPCTEQSNNPTMCLRVLSKSFLNSVRLGAVTSSL